MKVIFLDIDGVIKEDFAGAPFLDGSLSVLKEAVDETNAKLVMSSTWKVKYRDFIENGCKTEFDDIKKLYNALCEHGLSIYDYTPLIRIEHEIRRPTEIKEYIKSTKNIEGFCILDDRDEFLWEDLSKNLVLTNLGNDENGKKTAHLTEAHKQKIVDILNKEIRN